MAHYAFIDQNNIVVEVIVGRDENEQVNGITDWESYYASKRQNLTCKRTSYNANIRGTFAGIGYTYDPDTDTFTPPVVEDAPE